MLVCVGWWGGMCGRCMLVVGLAGWIEASVCCVSVHVCFFLSVHVCDGVVLWVTPNTTPSRVLPLQNDLLCWIVMVINVYG